MIDRFNIPYPVLLAQYGSVDTKLAQEKLPMLKEIRSYPTTIIIDKSGKVNSIHTGFNGPATGKAFEDFKKEFDNEIKKLSSTIMDLTVLNLLLKYSKNLFKKKVFFLLKKKLHLDYVLK